MEEQVVPSFKVLDIEGDDQLKALLTRGGVIEKATTVEDGVEVNNEQKQSQDGKEELRKQGQTNDEVQAQTKGGDQGSEVVLKEAPAFDVKAIFGEEFESVEDVKARLTLLATRPDIEVDEELKTIIDAKKAGWSVDEYLKVTRTNYDDLSDGEIVKLKMKADKPHLNGDEIEALYDDSYGFDEEADDERDVRVRKARLKDAAVTARAGLNEQKAKYVPKGVTDKEYATKAKEVWREGVNGFSIDELIVKKGEAEVIRYKVDPSVLGKVKGELSEMDTFFKPYIKSDGNVDMNALISDRVKARLFDDVVASAATLNASKGREEVVERRNNVSVGKDTKAPASDSERAQAKAMLDVLRQNGF
jgi:hypothetical protein